MKSNKNTTEMQQNQILTNELKEVNGGVEPHQNLFFKRGGSGEIIRNEDIFNDKN